MAMLLLAPGMPLLHTPKALSIDASRSIRDSLVEIQSLSSIRNVWKQFVEQTANRLLIDQIVGIDGYNQFGVPENWSVWPSMRKMSQFAYKFGKSIRDSLIE